MSRTKQYVDYDKLDKFTFWVHSLLPAVPETYAVRALLKDNKPELELKLVLFWALIEWSARPEVTGHDELIRQTVIPVSTCWDGGSAAVDVSLPDPGIMGYATRHEFNSEFGPCCEKEWRAMAKTHLKKMAK